MRKWMLLFMACSMFWILSAMATAGMSQLTVTDQVDPSTMAPISSKNVFTPGNPEIWASAYLENVPPGTTVAATWVYFDEKSNEASVIAQTGTQAEGSRYVAFRVAPNPGQTFPQGQYQVQFKLDQEKIGSVDFKVLSGNQPKPELLSQPQPEVKYINYKDKQGRFTVDLPGEWFPADVGNPNTAVFLSINKEDKPLARISISVFDASISKSYLPKNAVVDIRNKLLSESQQAGAKIVKDELVQDNAEATSWVMSFQYPGANGKEVEDRKIISCAKKRVYLLNFICETEISQTVIPVFKRVYDSFIAM